MTATYTPEVAAARERLGDATFLIEAFSGRHYTQARDYLRLLLDDHVRLAEEAVKLHTTIDRQTRKIAKIGERLHEHRVKLAKVQNEAAQHYSNMAALKLELKAAREAGRG